MWFRAHDWKRPIRFRRRARIAGMAGLTVADSADIGEIGLVDMADFGVLDPNEWERYVVVLITNGHAQGVSLWYPWVRRHHPVRVIPWERYRKFLRLRALVNVALFGCGWLLTYKQFYSEHIYSLFAAAVLVSSSVRVRQFIPTTEMWIIPGTTRIQLLLWAALDYAGTMFVAGMMLVVFAGQLGPDHLGGLFQLVAIFAFLLGFVCLWPGFSFILGRGRSVT